MEHLSAYTDWVIEGALPTWCAKGFDRGAGRFRERLDASGAPIDVPHRAMVQARQIYVFAHACLLGWHDDGGRLADQAMRSLRRDFASVGDREASFAFSIDGRGAVASDARDAYTHAFVLFALAWLHRVSADPSLLRLAEKTDAFVKAHLFDARHGGLFDLSPPTSRAKRQNPLMHLLEAYLALEHSAPGSGWLARAGELVDLFGTRMFDEQRGVLREHFAEDWSVHPDPALADVVEPGHHFEWAWLLREYEELAGTTLGTWSDDLYRFARRHGVGDDDLIYDSLTSDGTRRNSSHRVWPHTEAIKAAMSRHDAGDDDAMAFADCTARVLLDRFLDRPFGGGWVDHVAESGELLVEYVPASTLYHLFFAAAEADARSPRQQRSVTRSLSVPR